MDNQDNKIQRATTFAVEDLQRYLANAGRGTTEAAIMGWQQGYIAGINRGMELSNEPLAPEEA